MLTQESAGSDDTPKTPLLTNPHDRVYGSNRTSKGKHNRRIAAGGKISDEEGSASDHSRNMSSNKSRISGGDGACCFCFGLGGKSSENGILPPK